MWVKDTSVATSDHVAKSYYPGVSRQHRGEAHANTNQEHACANVCLAAGVCRCDWPLATYAAVGA